MTHEGPPTGDGPARPGDALVGAPSGDAPVGATPADARVGAPSGDAPAAAGPVVTTDDAGVVHVDGGDLGCARLLVHLRAHVATLDAGTVVHLTSTDPVAPIDLPAWCRLTGHTYLGPVGAAPDGRPVYAVEVAAAPAATDPARPWHRV